MNNFTTALIATAFWAVFVYLLFTFITWDFAWLSKPEGQGIGGRLAYVGTVVLGYNQAVADARAALAHATGK